LLGNGAVAIFIFNSLIPLASLGTLTNMNFTSGGVTKVLALLIFIVGVLWIGYGAILARRLNRIYREGTFSGQMFKNMAKNPQDAKKTKRPMLRAVGTVAALAADSAGAQILMSILPFPLNYFYWMGMWPFIPFIFFGLIPAIITFMGIGPLMGLAAVFDAGGDGTEYVEASKIHWFYSLTPKDRDRVREGSDLEGGSDDDSDSDGERRAKPRIGGPGRPVQAAN
jgi:hypothetical protein